MSVTVEGEILRETDKAICLRLYEPNDPEKDGEDIWFPLSQVEQIHHERKNGVGSDRLVVTDWIAKAKDL